MTTSNGDAQQGNSQIRAVIFDLDNTLIDRDEGFIRFSSELYKTSSVMSAAHTEDEAVAIMRSLDRSGYRSRPELFAEIIATWPGVFQNVEQALDMFAETFPRMLILEPSTKSLLNDLRDQSMPCAIVTNGAVRMQTNKVRETGLADLIKDIVISEGVGMNKPDRGIFEHALSLIGAEPSTSLFVGDNPEADILGAKALGMHTAWIHRGRDWLYEEQQPDYVLGHVSEVRGVVLG